MRVYRAELRRLLKTRYVQILLAAAIIFSAILAYFPVSFRQYVYQDENGQVVTVTGMDALRMEKERQGEFQGKLTEEKLTAAVRQYQEFVSGYEGGLPNGIYDERVSTVDAYENVFHIITILRRMCESWADPDSGLVWDMNELTETEAENFYRQCHQHLKDLIYQENGDSRKAESALGQAEALYSRTEVPFTYYPGVGMAAMEYMEICIFLLVLVSVIIAAPALAGDYQTQADQILKCTRYGKKRLVTGRVLAVITVLTAMYFLGVALFIILTNTAFGWESLRTSVQLLFSSATLLPLNVGEFEILIAAAGYVTLLASVCFTMFLSGRLRNVFMSAIVSVAALLIPIFLYVMAGGNAGTWLRCIFPSGGVGLGNSFLYAALDTDFAFAGSHAIWVPYLMMGAALVEIFIFAVLTVFNWCRVRK